MKTRGCISFVFDDGYEDVYQLVLPLLEKYGFKGVFAIPLESSSLSAETKQTMRPWPDWLSVTDNGHELAAHSISHTDLTKLSTDQLEKELHQPADTLHASTLVYPGGAYNDSVIASAQHFYSAARTVKTGFNALPPSDIYQLKTYNFSKHNFSVAKANLLATWAWLTNSWFIETYHFVSDKPADLLHSTVLNELEQHFRFIKKLPLANKTIRAITEHL